MPPAQSDRQTCHKASSYLSVRSDDGNFYICKALEDIYTNKRKKRYKIQWFEASKGKQNRYLNSYVDAIHVDSILCPVILTHNAKRTIFYLSREEEETVLMNLRKSTESDTESILENEHIQETSGHNNELEPKNATKEYLSKSKIQTADTEETHQITLNNDNEKLAGKSEELHSTKENFPINSEKLCTQGFFKINDAGEAVLLVCREKDQYGKDQLEQENDNSMESEPRNIFATLTPISDVQEIATRIPEELATNSNYRRICNEENWTTNGLSNDFTQKAFGSSQNELGTGSEQSYVVLENTLTPYISDDSPEPFVANIKLNLGHTESFSSIGAKPAVTEAAENSNPHDNSEVTTTDTDSISSNEDSNSNDDRDNKNKEWVDSDFDYDENEDSEDENSEKDDSGDESKGCGDKPIQGEKYKDTQRETDNELSDNSCSDNEGISVSYARKNSDGKLKWDKVHACIYCQKTLKKLSQHLEDRHENEMEVAKMLSMKKGSKERKSALEEITRNGDFFHNTEVMIRKKGELILVRRPNEGDIRTSYEDYGPCPRCLGDMKFKDFTRHSKYCPVPAPGTESGRKLKTSMVVESKLLLMSFLSTGAVKGFKENILAKMRDNSVATTAKEDWLILKLGEFFYSKHGNRRRYLVSESMRMVGRLLQAYRKLEGKILAKLEDCLKPGNFDKVIGAVKYASEASLGEYNLETFKTPSLALKLGHHLMKCSNILRGKALTEGDQVLRQESEDFVLLLKMEWRNRVSTHALTTLHNRKQNVPELLPSTADLLKLQKYLNKKLKELRDKLQHGPPAASWRSLAEIVVAKILVFNKRRAGEMAEMQLKTYSECVDWHGSSTEEFQATLSSLERRLCKRLKLIQIRGKRGRSVPVLLTPEVNEALQLLVVKRSEAGIDEQNKYLFARSSGVNHLRGHDCLRNVAQCANLEKPNLIRSTKLRKYIATVSQIMDLKDVELDWLARHLGHDIRIHRDYYRLHEATAELAKISKLLISVENGNVRQWAGKGLNDIDIPDSCVFEVQSSDEDSPVEDEVENQTEDNNLPRINDSDSEVEPRKKLNKEDESKQCRRFKKTAKKRKTNTAICSEDPLNDVSDESSHHLPMLKKRSNWKNTMKKTEGQSSSGQRGEAGKRRQTWTETAKESGKHFFARNILQGAVPGKEKCERFLDKFKEHLFVEHRNWKSVKYFVYNQIASVKRNK